MDIDKEDNLFVTDQDEIVTRNGKPVVKDQSFEKEDADPVIQEFPVVFNDRMANQLYLLQYPTRASQYPYVDAQGSGILEARVKARSGLVEVDVPIERGKYYDPDKSLRWGAVDRQTLGGVVQDCSEASNYMVGVFKNGELHVTPLKAIGHLRPQFKYIDRTMQQEKEALKREADVVRKKEARVVQMSAKSTGESAPTTSSSLTKSRLAQEEGFEKYEWFDRDRDETWTVTDDLVMAAEDRQILESTMTQDEYFRAIIDM